jgi:hypothetical protein
VRLFHRLKHARKGSLRAGVPLFVFGVHLRTVCVSDRID